MFNYCHAVKAVDLLNDILFLIVSYLTTRKLLNGYRRSRIMATIKTTFLNI